MRYFNTSGPCNPEEHYTVLRRDLIAQGLEKVRRGRYLTIFAPRQAGKTTYFRLLMEELRKTGQYASVQISFENLKAATKRQFYEVLNYKISRELAEYRIQPPLVITNAITLSKFFDELRGQCPALVVVIDEFEGTPDRVLGDAGRVGVRRRRAVRQ